MATGAPDYSAVVDVVDRAARAGGKVGLQVAGVDVAAGNPVPTSNAVSKAVDSSSVPSAARTVSGSSAGIDVSTFKAARLICDISAVSGVSPTIQIFLDILDPISGNWANLITFTPAASVGTTPSSSTGTVMGGTMRVRWGLGGTSVSFTFSISVLKEA